MNEATMHAVGSDLDAAAGVVIERGFAIFRWSDELEALFHRLVDAHACVPESTRASFSFPQHNDGFLPFGTEYATERARPDLCRRFNHWHAHRSLHDQHPYSKAPLYQAARGIEERMFPLAETFLAALARRLGSAERLRVRRMSYLQLCDYEPSLRDPARKFLQEPHEDGHLLTFVKQTAEGLALRLGGALHPVHLGPSEVIVYPGSLLTSVTDGRIAPMYHAVLPTPPSVHRRSLMYFVNPDAARGASWVHGKPLDLAALTEAAQIRFGRPRRPSAP